MKFKILAATILFGLPAIASPIFAQQAAPPDDAPYKNPKLPTDQRVKDLISRMTLEEKAAQVGHTAPAIPRLGVPEYNWWNEGLHGVARAGIAAVFPQAIGLATRAKSPAVKTSSGLATPIIWWGMPRRSSSGTFAAPISKYR